MIKEQLATITESEYSIERVNESYEKLPESKTQSDIEEAEKNTSSFGQKKRALPSFFSGQNKSTEKEKDMASDDKKGGNIEHSTTP